MKKQKGLPPYTYAWTTKRCFLYKPYLGGGRKEKRPSVLLKDPHDRLLRPGCPISEVWQAWELLQGKQHKTIGWLLDAYLASHAAKQLNPITVKEYRRQALFIKRYPLKGNRMLFGDVDLKSLTPGAFRKYLDTRAEDGSPISGNREVALVSIAWSWAKERDDVRMANPSADVKRNPEVARTRYVTDDEYAGAFELAVTYRYLRPAMEFAYLCRLRQCEVRALRKSDITEKGLDCKRFKGSRDALTLWSPRLRDAVRMACEIERDVDSIYLLHNANGQPLTKDGFDSSWRRLKAQMHAGGVEPFNFHDLKAKGISDFAGDKQKAGGHRTAAMVAIYDRKKPEVDSTR